MLVSGRPHFGLAKVNIDEPNEPNVARVIAPCYDSVGGLGETDVARVIALCSGAAGELNNSPKAGCREEQRRPPEMRK